jgi:hypothetical protein
MSSSLRFDDIKHSTIAANSIHFQIIRSQDTNRSVRGKFSLFHQKRHCLFKVLLQEQELTPVTAAIRV